MHRLLLLSVITALAPTWALLVNVTVQDTDPLITYLPSGDDWPTYPSANYLGGSLRASRLQGASASLTFTGGSMVYYMGDQNFDHGSVTIALDGVNVMTANAYSANQVTRAIMFSSPVDPTKQHTITIMNDNTGMQGTLDSFIYTIDNTSLASSISAAVASTPTPTPTGSSSTSHTTAIVAGIIAGAVAIAAIRIGFFFFSRRRVRDMRELDEVEVDEIVPADGRRGNAAPQGQHHITPFVLGDYRGHGISDGASTQASSGYHEQNYSTTSVYGGPPPQRNDWSQPPPYS